ncbi:MAG TPA: prepilin-type N-terminal cleavage/methylation domain-containing protein [Verrucomicrobiae bacterium]|nr:prepilin-type N-terminal cleavage/methylation domain-containing protein [Verrucomicrobiae bacterium]
MTTCFKEVFGRQTSKVGPSRFFSRNLQNRGFTLIELMFVVGIFAVLAALLLPALNRSRARAQAILCMGNSRQLSFAWTMYSSENNSSLAYNLSPNMQQRSFAPTINPNWINNVMDWELTPGNTNQNFITQSILAPYASYSANIYHCPADHFLSDVQKAAGWTARVRSMSMNAMVGDPGIVLQNGGNINNPGFQQFVKESDFRDASSIFVFLDEHPDSIDDGYFLDTPPPAGGRAEWVDLPASYHNGGGSFSFADGHTEIHRWRSASTIRPVNNAGLPFVIPTGDTADFDWVIKHTSFSTQ